MDFAGSNSKLFLLSLLFTASCFQAQLSRETESLPPHYFPATSPAPHHHHHHHHPPAIAPAQPPTHHHHHHHPHPPTKPPTHSPASPPVHPPVKPPVKPPAQPPVKPPAHPPVHPPVKPPSHHFPRRFVAVQGVVYCKSCKYAGVDTLLGASPVMGATVKLQCNNTKYPVVVKVTTDKNGYFLLKAPPIVTNYGAHRCKAFLVSAPTTACSKVTDFHSGASGAVLMGQKPVVLTGQPFVVFTVGPFAFEPKCPR